MVLDKASQDANEVLLNENKRLREQIEDLRVSTQFATCVIALSLCLRHLSKDVLVGNYFLEVL